MTPTPVMSARAPYKVGDLVWHWYDTGAFGYEPIYGRVTGAGPKKFFVTWESGRRNLLPHDTHHVKPVEEKDRASVIAILERMRGADNATHA